MASGAWHAMGLVLDPNNKILQSVWWGVRNDDDWMEGILRPFTDSRGKSEESSVLWKLFRYLHLKRVIKIFTRDKQWVTPLKKKITICSFFICGYSSNRQEYLAYSLVITLRCMMYTLWRYFIHGFIIFALEWPNFFHRWMCDNVTEHVFKQGNVSYLSAKISS